MRLTSDDWPPWLQAAAHTLAREDVLISAGVASLAVFVLTLAGVPWLLARLPEDYFSESRAPSSRAARHAGAHPAGRLLLKVAKNLLGLALALAGVVMLFAPGQGLLTLFAASFLLDFPGKRRLQRRVLQRPAILRAVNRMRERRGRAPFVL